VFQEVRLRERGLVAVRPRPKYAPLFAYALWRQHVAGGVRSSWACRRTFTPARTKALCGREGCQTSLSECSCRTHTSALTKP